MKIRQQDLYKNLLKLIRENPIKVGLKPMFCVFAIILSVTMSNVLYASGFDKNIDKSTITIQNLKYASWLGVSRPSAKQKSPNNVKPDKNNKKDKQNKQSQNKQNKLNTPKINTKKSTQNNKTKSQKTTTKKDNQKTKKSK